MQEIKRLKRSSLLSKGKGMEAKAVTRYVRISSMKLRLPINEIKGKNAGQALTLLKFMPLKAAGIIYKTLQSAIANAENTKELDVDKLVVKNIFVDQGPSVKRFRPRARGRASRILKRTSHLTVIVESSVK
jgi:large subunit ribosomal protein L22